jgi:hypothetical protein
MANEIDELKKLSVEERIKKLKEIEQKNKDEIKKAQEMLKQSEFELEEKEKEKESTPIPQMKAADIGELFTEEEKQLFKTKRFEEKKPAKKEALEETVFSEGKKLKPEQIEQIQQQYRTQLSRKPVDELYDRMKNIYQNIQASGAVSPEQVNQINNIEYAIDKKKEDIEKGEYNPSEYVANRLVAVQQIGEDLKKKYRGR